MWKNWAFLLISVVTCVQAAEAGSRRKCCCDVAYSATSAQAAVSPAAPAAAAGPMTLTGDVNMALLQGSNSGIPGQPNPGGQIGSLLGDVNPGLLNGNLSGTSVPPAVQGLLNSSDASSLETWKQLALYQAKLKTWDELKQLPSFDLRKSSLTGGSRVGFIAEAELDNVLHDIHAQWSN